MSRPKANSATVKEERTSSCNMCGWHSRGTTVRRRVRLAESCPATAESIVSTVSIDFVARKEVLSNPQPIWKRERGEWSGARQKAWSLCSHRMKQTIPVPYEHAHCSHAVGARSQRRYAWLHQVQWQRQRHSQPLTPASPSPEPQLYATLRAPLLLRWPSDLRQEWRNAAMKFKASDDEVHNVISIYEENHWIQSIIHQNFHYMLFEYQL